MRAIGGFVCLMMSVALIAPAQASTNVLFIGNSFTVGDSPRVGAPSVGGYKPFSVTDLNGTSFGGVPALFKEFTVQAGLDYRVSLETGTGYTIKDHYNNRLGLIDRSWDVVVLQSHSVLDPGNPGDPAQLITYTGLLADIFHARNAAVDIYLTSTWSRADLTYLNPSPWFGRPIDTMANDVQAGYEQAAAASQHVTDVVEVGAAWNDAMLGGLADSNPYNGVTAGQINLWGTDSYHASFHGSYLSALMQFGAITGVDPRLLGPNETAATYLGFTSDQAVRLQNLAYSRLQASKVPQGVPEPTSWAMLLFGFGMIGTTLRHRRAASPFLEITTSTQSLVSIS